MSTWLSFISVSLAIAAGILLSRKAAVRLYFWAQVPYTLVVFFGVRALGIHDVIYAVLYTAVTLPIIECCCFMIWQSGLSSIHLRVSIAFGAFIGMVASFGMPPHPGPDYVTFAEGVILSMLAVAMLLAAAQSENKAPLQVIGRLSLCLSCYDFGWLRNRDWAELNDWFPSAICTVAFIVLALAERIHSRQPEALPR